jgi:hypothetical protein
MLKAIVKRGLGLGVPAGALYLAIFYAFATPGKSWLAAAALLFPLFAVAFEAAKALRQCRQKNDHAGATMVGRLLWSACIGISVILFAITFPTRHWQASSVLIAVPLLIKRLVDLRKAG